MKIRVSLILITISIVFVLVLGAVGFHQSDPEAGWATAVYKAIPLFSMGSGVVDGKTPLLLEVARWLAPMVTLGGVFAMANALLKTFHDGWRLLFIRRHVIVCGAGEKGAAIVRDLLSSGDQRPRVVVIEVEEEENAALRQLRRQGAIVIHGDARHSNVLTRANLAHASRIVCETGRDTTNLEVAQAASKLVAQTRSDDPLLIHVHVTDVNTRDVFQRNGVFGDSASGPVRLRYFSYYANLARRILDAFPLEMDNAGGLAEDVYLVVTHLDSVSTALIAQAALVGHYRDGGKVTVTLLSCDAQGQRQRLLNGYPGIEKCLKDLRALDLAHPSEFVSCVTKMVSELPSGGLATVFHAGEDEDRALVDALTLLDRVHERNNFRIILDAEEESVVRKLCAGRREGEDGAIMEWIRFAPLKKEVAGREAVFFEAQDLFAKRIHQTWYDGNSAAAQKAEASGDHQRAEELRSKATFHPWEDLTEEQKDVNRAAADHLKVKVRAVGMDPSDSQNLRDKWKELDDCQIEILSRMEHERWCAPLYLSGWSAGPRDDKRRTHDNLVPYDDLDESTKDYDRDQVRAVAGYLVPEELR